MKDRREAKKNGKKASIANVAEVPKAVEKDAEGDSRSSGEKNQQPTIADIFSKVPAKLKKDEE